MTFTAEQAQRDRAFAREAGGGPLWHFLRGFLKHPVMVGSVIPSSKILIDKMLEPVDWPNTKLFIEYGPGVGTFTQHILDRLAPDATLLTIDTNPDFTSYLNSKFMDSRLEAVTGSAASVASVASVGNVGNVASALSVPSARTAANVGNAAKAAAVRVLSASRSVPRRPKRDRPPWPRPDWLRSIPSNSRRA